MEALKLTNLEKQTATVDAKIKVAAKDGSPYHIGNCSCPCWAFIKEGEVVKNDIRSTASWNID